MRLQRLRISAFGPFADPVDLDFGALNDAGLFLLTGSNGAGKSSILDAVCFALYGAVPGERNAARRYRSDHAAPDQAPTVELEASFSSGTYRIVRTAAWERPKRRGSGTTTQQSSVSVLRRDGGAWQPVTQRLDEAGQLMTRLVGMNLTQFCQVVILPQGKFQAFLQSSATERQALLQQLFHTGRFQRVEAWLRDRRLSLRRTSLEHQTAVLETVSRISEVSGVAAPEDLSDPPSWASGLRDVSELALAGAVERATAATFEEAATRDSLESARDLASRLDRLRTATAERSTLASATASVEALRVRVDAARRAAPVAVLTPLVRARRSALDDAVAGQAAATVRLLETTGTVPADLALESEALRGAVARVEALLPRADEAESLTREAVGVAAELVQTEARHAELEASDVAELMADLVARREEVRAAQVAMPQVRGAIDEAQTRLNAHAQVATLTAAHADAVTQLSRATAAALDAKDAWLTVRELRIEGMAAELAGGLAVGADCPVCGSHDHPHPAQAHAGAPDAEAERQAHRAVDDANAVQHAFDHRVRELVTQLEQARLAAGDVSVPELRATIDARRAESRALRQALDAAAALESSLTEVVERQQAETVELQALRERRAVLHERRVDHARRLAALADELSAALAGTPYDDVRRAHADLCERLEAVRAAASAAHALHEAGTALAEASGARVTAALEAGFASTDDAERALLPPGELGALGEEICAHDARVAAVTAQLAAPELGGLDDVAAPDVPALAAAHLATEAARGRAEAAAATCRRTLERLDALLRELTARHDAWAPVQRELELATHLSAFCEGKAADNRWQMQLSAYVVAWRLSQVADAANVRLSVMTHGRYSLEHTDLRSAGERRGGMTLVVRDDWTGVSRDPVTLSGGETFVVALALALGLADVITAEAGGASLQTLFVDEGFGMLDATSLDLVMDTLDSLRESGRTVGVVSHVAEMRSRIPVQVQVHKPHDHGPSTVRLRA